MDKTSIIHRLASKLNDDVLRELFPQSAPQVIRDLLLAETAGSAPPSSAFSAVEKQSLLRCRLFTDGASRGNPGKAGAGAVLLDEYGRELVTKSEFLGVCTNNLAEYQALILGLRAAREIGCRKVDIFLDSELIVRQVRGTYKVKNAALKPLYTKVQQLLQWFEHYTIAHVPRSENARADELANRGIDERD